MRTRQVSYPLSRVLPWQNPLIQPHKLHKQQKLSLLKIYSFNLALLQRFNSTLFNQNLSSSLKRNYLLPSLKTHTHSIISAYSLLPISSKLSLRIQIDTRALKDFIYLQKKRRRGSGQTCFWRSYMCLLALLFIWEFMKSLVLICIGIQTSIKALYTRLQTIYHSAALSKSKGIAIFLI